MGRRAARTEHGRGAFARAAAVGALVAALPLPSSVARADTCGPAPGLDFVQPTDGTTGVHPAARVTVRHALVHAPPFDEPPRVVLRDATGGAVPATFSWEGRDAALAPRDRLAPNARYEVEAERPGREPWRFSFETGSQTGLPAAPVLGPALSARATYLGAGPEDDPCGPDGLERYRVRLALPAAAGSSGAANVVYVAFETAGHGVTEPTERTRVVDEGASRRVGLDLYLPAEGVSGRACFRALALDVAGGASGTTEEACVRLAEGPFFRSLCSLATTAPPGRAAPVGVAFGLVVLLGFGRCYHRRRRRLP